MCFYGDTAYAIFLWVVTKFFSQGLSEESLMPVTTSILGVFGHGCGHLWLGMKGITRVGTLANEDKPLEYHVKYLAVLAFFWYTLTMVHAKLLGRAVHAVFVVLLLLGHYYFVPLQCAFAYVQTALIILMSTVTMLRKDKISNYNAVSLITVPSVLAAWVEGLMCDSFLVHFGGHFWYDMSIPIALTGYIVYLKHEQSSQSKVKAE